MIQKIKNSLVAVAMLTSLFAPALVTVNAYAATNAIQNGLCTGADAAAGSSTASSSLSSGSTETCDQSGSSNATSQIASIASTIIQIFSIIVGVVAVVMIIVGGFRYITSGGESSNVSGAKNTIIYAIIGLVLVALAQVIVHVVLNKATSVTG